MQKKINVTSPLMPRLERYEELLEKIWDSKWLTNDGAMCKELKNKLEEKFDDKVELFVNGHMALDTLIKTMDLRGEVITTPYTFASTTHAIVMNGLKPVFCDINENDYTIDVEKIEALITENTCAILPVHVYGCPCDVDRIEEIARKHNLKVIYDAAHAFGVKKDGKSITAYGDASMFSFHATKVFNTVEGGAVVYSDEKLTNGLRYNRNFGIENAESIVAVGYNAKMNELCAAMGICNLEIVDDAIKRRKEIVYKYCECFSEIRGIKMLDYERLEKRGVEYNFSYMPIEVTDELGISRNELFEQLKEQGIIARKYFYPLIVDYECYREEFKNYDLPIAKRVAENILTIPLYATLTNEEVERICNIIKKICVD